LDSIQSQVDGYGAENTYNGFNGGSNGVWKDGSIDGSASDGLILNGTAHTVSGMTIHNVCYIGTYRGAIRTGGKDPVIRGNTLYDSGRFLVYHGGTPGGSIDHNEMYNAGLMTHDLGATYCFQTEGGGMTIAYNYVHDITTAVGCGIYLDNGSSNYKVHHNVVENVSLTGIKVNLPSYGNQVVNNTIWNCKYSIEGGGSTRPQEMSGTALVNNLINNAIRVITTGSYPATLINNGSYPTIAFVGSTFQLASTSGAIDQGVVRSPYTNGYSGSAPDIGAFEYGQTPWTCGSTVPVPAFPYPDDFSGSTPTVTKTRSSTPTPSRTPTATPSPTPSRTTTATPSPTPSRTPTATPSPTSSRTPTATPSATPSKTATGSATLTAGSCYTRTGTPSVTLSATPDNTAVKLGLTLGELVPVCVAVLSGVALSVTLGVPVRV
jgi:hypothetical protein